MNKRFILIGAVAIGLIVIAAATMGGSRNNGATTSEPDLRVAATIYPIYDLVRSVAGDAVDVALIVPPGSSPHTFDVTPELATSLGAADVVFAVGNLDEWLEPLISSDRGDLVVLSDAVILREFGGHEGEHGHEEETRDEHGHEEEGGEESHDHGAYDPHYWLSVPNAQRVVVVITDVLSERDPGNAEGYQARRDTLLTELEELDADIRSTLTNLPTSEIVVMHDAWGYFAEEYGITIAATFQPSPGNEPLPRDVEALQEIVREHGVTTIFREPQMSDASLRAIANDLNITIGVLDPLGGAEGRTTYEELMRYNAEAVAEALGATHPDASGGE